jgi:mannonate dehydratase
MRRREFLAALSAPALLGGCGLSLEHGLMNECRRPDGAQLASHPLVEAAWSGLRADRVWDCHVHLFGNGRGGTGIHVDPSFEGGWNPASRVRHVFFMNAACAGRDDGAIDSQVVARLAQLADAQPAGAKLMLLAFDDTYDDAGRRRPDLTTFSVPNGYANQVAQSRPDRFEWIASIHPYREDAVEALAKVHASGARAIKWLPPTMNIDLASPRCIPFYEALARLDMPLLVHMDEEQSVHGAGRIDLANPLLVRHPLDRGVRVIVAHCASLGASEDTDAAQPKSATRWTNFALFMRLMEEKRYVGRLFGDISAIPQANRSGVLPILLTRRSWEGRILNGSDYPLPGILPLFSLKQLVAAGVLAEGVVGMLRELRESHSILFDFVLKRNLSFRGMKLASSAFETRDFFVRT